MMKHIEVPVTFVTYLLGLLAGSFLTIAIWKTAEGEHWGAGIFVACIVLIFLGLISSIIGEDGSSG